MHATGPLLRPGDRSRLGGDAGSAFALAEGGVPHAVLGEQRRHFLEPVVVELEAVGGEQFADRVLVGLFVGHGFLRAAGPGLSLLRDRPARNAARQALSRPWSPAPTEAWDADRPGNSVPHWNF